MTLWPVLFAFLPIVNILARLAMPTNIGEIDVLSDGTEIDPWFPAGIVVWMAIGIALAILRVAHMSFS